VWIVLRVDAYQESASIEDKVYPVAAFMDESSAHANAGRVNHLNARRGSRYVVLVSRLKG
jgi:hypothetical protein